MESEPETQRTVIWTTAPIGDIFGLWEKMNEARSDGDYALEDKHLSDAMKLYITKTSEGVFTLEQTVDVAKMFDNIFERSRPLREQASLLLSSVQDMEKRERDEAKEHMERKKPKAVKKGNAWPYVPIG